MAYLKQRSPGSWSVQIYHGRDEDGRKRYKWHTVRGPRDEAELFAKREEVAIADGERALPQRMTAGELLLEWLDFLPTRERRRPRARTIQEYRGYVERYAIPGIGALRLQAVTFRDLERLYHQLEEKGYATGTRRQLHGIFSGAFKYAVRMGYLARSPAALAEAPELPDREAAMLSLAEAKRLLEVSLESRFGPVLALALHTGLRRSELLGLQWGDIDFEQGWLSVVRGRHALTGVGIIIEPPKSRRGRRRVDIAPEIIAMLREVRTRAAPACPYVFQNTKGGPWHPDAATHGCGRLMRDAGLSLPPFLGARHTSASLLLSRGFYLKMVAERFGHLPTVAADRYSHVLPGSQRAAAVALAELLGRPGVAVEASEKGSEQQREQQIGGDPYSS